MRFLEAASCGVIGLEKSMSINVNDKARDLAVARADAVEPRKAGAALKATDAAQGPKNFTPQSDPFTEALRESTDSDGDMERAGSGRVRREGVKEDDGEAANNTNDQVGHKRVRKSENSQGESSTQTKRIQERERSSESTAPSEGAEKTSFAKHSLSPVENQSKSNLETISLSKSGTASHLLQRSFHTVQNILDTPNWNQERGKDSQVTLHQMTLAQ